MRVLAVACVLFGLAFATLGANAAGQARAHAVTLASPPQFDLEVARISLATGHGRAPHLSLALAGPTGFSYVAAAVLGRHRPGRAELLVVASNRRPRGSLAPDIAFLRLRIRGSRRLGVPHALVRTRVFGTPPAGPARRGFCGLASRANGLRVALSSGPAPGRLAATRLLTGGYAAACGLPYDPAVRNAVTGGLVCPPNALCAPPRCPPNALCLPPRCPPICQPPPCPPNAQCPSLLPCPPCGPPLARSAVAIACLCPDGCPLARVCPY